MHRGLTRRHVLATALLGWLTLPALASADVEWCFDDSPVLVRLPSGAPLNINVRVRVPAGRRAQLKATAASAGVSVGPSGTVIQVTTLVPAAAAGAFPVLVTASAGELHTQVTAEGMAGSPLILTVPVVSAEDR